VGSSLYTSFFAMHYLLMVNFVKRYKLATNRKEATTNSKQDILVISVSREYKNKKK